ncbi:MAG: GAF domain-containing protein, partial [Flavobacteriales bacterium]
MENKQEIQEYRKFFESVFDRIPGMIYVHDMVNDVNLYRSWSLKKLLGYEESPILKSGIHIRSLVHPNDEAAVEQAVNQMLSAKDDERVSYSYRMKHQDGHWLWFRSEEYVYARDKQGKPSVVLGYATEITASVNQQQELDEINKVNQLLLNAAQILSRPDTSYHSALNALAKEVSENLNVVCDISILEPETGIIKPEAVYHFNPDVKAVVEHLFSTLSVKKGQGLVGSVIETGKEIVITDVPESMRRGVRAVDELIVPQSIVYLPITGADSVLGALSLTRLEGESAFTEVQIEQIRRLGKYLSLFVENRLLKERQEHNSELREQAELTLENEKNWADFKVEVSTFLADVDLDLTTAMLQFAEKVAERFNAVCAIQLVNDERDEILMVALHHPNKSIRDKIENSLQRTTLQVGKGLVGKVVSTGREYVSLQLPKDLEKMAKSGKVPMEIMPSSIAYLPLNGQHGVLGTLSITTLYSEKNLSETDINQLRDLALHTARFIENRVLQIKQNREIGLRRKAEKRLERAGEVLQRKEAETRSILNTIPINIARISKDFRYKFLNEAYRNLGVDPNEMEGRLIKEVIGEVGFEKLLPLFKRALKGETISYDFDGLMVDGVHRYFNVALAPDYSELGEVIGFYSCASDVTSKVVAEKGAKLTQERLDSLSLNSGDAFF